MASSGVEITSLTSTPPSEALFGFLNNVLISEKERIQNLNVRSSWLEWTLYQWKEGFLRPLAIWFAWMLTGTLYFGSVDFGSNYYKGFYYSVNVGYNVGWGVLQLKYRYSKIFAGFYLIMGALFAVQYIAYLIQYAVDDEYNLYQYLRINRNIERSTRLKGWIRSLYVYAAMNSEKLFMIYAWLLLLFFGAFFTVCTVHWPWLDGFYYALTSMSTAGLEGIPPDSPDYLFVITGLMTAVGVPVMAMAIGNIGLLIAESHSVARVEAIVDQKLSITKKELAGILQVKLRPPFQSDDDSVTSGGDVSIDRNEYLLASLVRMKACDIELVYDLLKKFDSIDVAHLGRVALSQVSDSNAEEKAKERVSSRQDEQQDRIKSGSVSSSNATTWDGYAFLPEEA